MFCKEKVVDGVAKMWNNLFNHQQLVQSVSTDFSWDGIILSPSNLCASIVWFPPTSLGILLWGAELLSESPQIQTRHFQYKNQGSSLHWGVTGGFIVDLITKMTIFMSLVDLLLHSWFSTLAAAACTGCKAIERLVLEKPCKHTPVCNCWVLKHHIPQTPVTEGLCFNRG